MTNCFPEKVIEVLEAYNLKEIDKYLWLLGKDYFLKVYSKKTKKAV